MTTNSLLIHVFCKLSKPESVLPVLQIETKTIFTSSTCRKSNKESIFKYWFDWRNYWYVSYYFIWRERVESKYINGGQVKVSRSWNKIVEPRKRTNKFVFLSWLLFRIEKKIVFFFVCFLRSCGFTISFWDPLIFSSGPQAPNIYLTTSIKWFLGVRSL